MAILITEETLHQSARTKYINIRIIGHHHATTVIAVSCLSWRVLAQFDDEPGSSLTLFSHFQCSQEAQSFWENLF